MLYAFSTHRRGVAIPSEYTTQGTHNTLYYIQYNVIIICIVYTLYTVHGWRGQRVNRKAEHSWHHEYGVMTSGIFRARSLLISSLQFWTFAGREIILEIIVEHWHNVHMSIWSKLLTWPCIYIIIDFFIMIFNYF